MRGKIWRLLFQNTEKQHYKNTEMNTRILKIAIMGGLMTVGLMNCSQSNEAKSKTPNKGQIEMDANVIKTASDTKTIEIDSLIDYFSYASIIEVRFLKNNLTLNHLKNNVTSLNDSVQLGYDKEFYELNKRNLEIKTKVQDHINQDPKQWKIFKKSINDEMTALEKSISELAEKKTN